MIRVHRIPFSTNVERVALACGMKGVAVEWVDHDLDDRRQLRELSGQGLVPVAEFGHEVVPDSIAILEQLDRVAPDPPLYPAAPSDRALAEIFLEWFNQVWKVPPNALTADPPPAPDASRALISQMESWTDLFERRLSQGGYLLGAGPGVADVAAYPFLRYAVDAPAEGDDEPFHDVLHRRLSEGQHPALDDWIARMATLPQA